MLLSYITEQELRAVVIEHKSTIAWTVSNPMYQPQTQLILIKVSLNCVD